MVKAAQYETTTQDGGETRRDFLVLTAGALGAIGAAAFARSLINSMSPARDTLAAGAPVDVDISHLEEGQQIVVLWRSRPIFLVHRSPAELATLQASRLLSQLRDPNSIQLQQPKYAENWHRSIKPQWLVLVGICTHLGCIPIFTPTPGALGNAWLGGYFCPCHGSKYDLAGRVFIGVPAPLNLPVPPYKFVSDTVIRIGENPPGSNFALGSVEQL